MQVKRKTMIVTGASQGIGAGVTKAFINRGYNVVANSRKISSPSFRRRRGLSGSMETSARLQLPQRLPRRR